MAQRHPRNTPSSNPHGTAPPTRHAHRHGTAPPTRHAIAMAQRHPRDTPSSNPHGTAPPRRHAQQQSPWHSAARATRATRPTPIVTACHCVRHSAERATRPTQPAAAFQETSAPSSHPQIHGFPAPATISQRPTRARTRDLSHGATKSRDFSNRARFIAPAPERINASEVPRLPREPQVAARKIMRARARDTPGTQSPRHGAADTARQHAPSTLPARTIPAACHAKRTLTMRVQNTPGTQSPRHSAAARPRHTSNTPDPRSLPRKTMPRSQKCARRHTRTLATRPIPAACHAKRCPGRKNVHGATRARSRERRSEPDSRTGPRFRKPRRGHPAAIIVEFRRLGRKIREQDSRAR